MNDFLAILDGASQLWVNALADKNDLNQCEVGQVSPAHAS